MTPGRDAFFCSFSRCASDPTTFFRDAYQIFNQKWLGNEILDAIHVRPKTLLDVRPLAMNKNGMCRVDSRARSFSKSCLPSRPGIL